VGNDGEIADQLHALSVRLAAACARENPGARQRNATQPDAWLATGDLNNGAGQKKGAAIQLAPTNKNHLATACWDSILSARKSLACANPGDTKLNLQKIEILSIYTKKLINLSCIIINFIN
jgi:hypothetical protein